MKTIIIYSVILLWSYCSCLNYCDLQKAFCKEHDHVACFRELNLPGMFGGNKPQTCSTEFINEINQLRTDNHIVTLNGNEELEMLAALTLDYTPATCGISMKYRDTKLFFAQKYEQGANTMYEFHPDAHITKDTNATDVGCSCKKFSPFIYCWYNYSKRSTVAEYQDYLNGT